MTPWEIVRTSEHSHQVAFFAYMNCAALYGFAWADHPECYALATRDRMPDIVGKPSYEAPQLTRIFAIHNQGHGDAIRGVKAKAEGVKAGVPDIFVPICVDHCAGLFIELKRPKQKIKDESKQDDWRQYLNSACYQSHECVGWEAAVERVKLYVWPLIPSWG